jgi:putative transcriptional regulator
MDKDRPSTEAEPGAPDLPAGPDDLKGPDGGHAAHARSGPATAGYLQGQLLIATPAIGDQRFERTVLLVCVHDETQAMALMLNRPMQGLKVPALLRRLGLGGKDVPEAPVLSGGPVERERGYVLHTDDYRASHSTLPVAPGLALTDTREVLDALGDPQRRPRRFLLALGYAGWGAGQLESEIRQGAWLTCDADEALVFGRDVDGLWAAALAKIGVQPERLSIQTGRA